MTERNIRDYLRSLPHSMRKIELTATDDQWHARFSGDYGIAWEPHGLLMGGGHSVAGATANEAISNLIKERQGKEYGYRENGKEQMARFPVVVGL